MIYHPVDCDFHFGPCPTDDEVDAMRHLAASLPCGLIRYSENEAVG